MVQYLAKRIGRSILTLFVIVTLVFCLLRLMPVEGYFANYEKMTEAQIQAGLQSMGLLDPLPVQIGHFWRDALHGDLGVSHIYKLNAPVTRILAQKLPISIEMGVLAMLLSLVFGIPLGLLLGASKTAHSLIYPVFEIMRPVPPLAWVPVAVIFWPTPEMSMVFVTFLGAFFIVVINIVDGVHSIDARYLRAARSLGSSRSDMFWHILLPGSLPSIVVGMTVGMGVTWAVVVAAEMIASRTGLGYLTWSAYVAGEFPVIIIGMMSIGIAGYVCSAIIRFAGTRMTPWLRTF